MNVWSFVIVDATRKKKDYALRHCEETPKTEQKKEVRKRKQAHTLWFLLGFWGEEREGFPSPALGVFFSAVMTVLFFFFPSRYPPKK
jgi:hypothetical protein